MKIRSLIIGAALIIGTAFITSHVVSQEAKAPPTLTPEQQKRQQEMEKKWMEFMTPGEQHQMLAKRTGHWNFVNKWWMEPGAPAQEAAGTCEYSSIFDNRYTTCHVSSSMDGQPFEGMGCWGYDNLKKKYFFAWIDSMGTGMMVSEGTYDAKTRTYTYQGDMPNFDTGKYENAKTVERFESDDKYVMEMWCKKDGKDFKCMEITYTRAK
jgi:hypothetical protein